MSIERFQLLRNVGQFHSVNAGSNLPLTKLTLIYAENGRGKTTLAAMLRSAKENNPQPLMERQRLGAANPPHIVIGLGGGANTMFQDGAWTTPLPNVAIFDDAFVAENICSGVEIETSHCQNLHELILGAHGVALNTALQGHVARIEQHNQTLRQKEASIPAAGRGPYNVDAFCALQPDAEVDTRITAVERALAAARAADPVRQQSAFTALELPGFDVPAINALLGRTLPDLETDAANRVRAHIEKLGRGGEDWINNGMSRVQAVSSGEDHEICPFCAQDLQTSSILRNYQTYFSQAYSGLKTAIVQTDQTVATVHSGEAMAGFERSVRIAVQRHEFWRAFLELPALDVDTAAITRAWIAARDAVLLFLRAKVAAPLESVALAPEAIDAIEAYEQERVALAAISANLLSCNPGIALVKERTATANVATLTADLARFQAIKIRNTDPYATACREYLLEKDAKAATEQLRTQSRANLDNYRQNIFPAYEAAINNYLQRFNAGFRIASVTPVNNRGGSSCNYNLVINNVQVTLSAATGPSFRNTLSAGDRNTLALAFFFASLDQDQQLGQKIVVIDDPMTSLDEHRALTTVQEMRNLLGRVRQAIVMSHSKPFLCAIWEGTAPADRTGIIIRRDANGSTFDMWDVNQDCITEHDRRHQLVVAYIQNSDPAKERQVAAALRPILEVFMRVAYPAFYPPGTLLGPFIHRCVQSLTAGTLILNQQDITELRALLDYANRFHHDSNAAWETAAINDQELTNFCTRTLAFAQRR